jgi:hypothetical protein
MSKVRKPKGVSFYLYPSGYRSLNGPPALTIGSLVKSRGRTGAAIRSRLTRLSAEAQQPLLRSWARGHAVEMPA